MLKGGDFLDYINDAEQTIDSNIKEILDNISYTTLISGGVLDVTITATALPALTNCKSFLIQAHPNNVGNVYIGKSTLSTSDYIAIISPGSSIGFSLSNSTQVYFLGTAGDHISLGVINNC